MITTNVAVLTMSFSWNKTPNRGNKGGKLNNQTRKAHGQSSLCIKKARRHRLLLIMTILGHDRSKCCRVDHVLFVEQNTKSRQQRRQNQQSNTKGARTIIPVHKEST
jgi:hypothetical protein